MFDKYLINENKQPNKVTIKEYKAPTTDSIKLLREMEQEAFNSIKKQFIVDTNILKGVVTYCHTNHFEQGLDCFYSFTLNNKEFHIKKQLKHNYIINKDMRKILKNFCDVLGKTIAQELILNSTEDVEFRNFMIQKD